MAQPPLPVPDRVITAMRTSVAIGTILIGIALAATLMDQPRIALAAIIPVLFILLFSIDALRVLVTSIREYRR